MEMVGLAQQLTLGFYALGVLPVILGALVTVLAMFLMAPLSWKAKAAILFLIVNEIRGAAVAAPIAWALFN